MRISDWSSDVCSSDLLAAGNRLEYQVDRRALFDHLQGRRDMGEHAALGRNIEALAHGIQQVQQADAVRHAVAGRVDADHRIADAEQQDRKSDVEGKSVSVRVDPGGRRSSKKQKTK